MNIFDEIFDARILNIFKASTVSGVPYYLLADNEGPALYKKEFIKHLELAKVYGGLTKENKRRLRTTKWEIFWQTKAEFQVAYFINKMLGYEISFKPEGNKNCYGDVSLIVNESYSIFVEIKSPYRQTPNGVWTGDDSQVIKSNLDKAYRQVPYDKPSVVVFVADLRAGSPNKDLMIKSLYGEMVGVPKWKTVGIEIEVVDCFEWSGYFQKNIHRKISAVAVSNLAVTNPWVNHLFYGSSEPENKSDIYNYTFDVYHNPFANIPIETTIFKQYPQFCLNANKSEMVWVNKNQ